MLIADEIIFIVILVETDCRSSEKFDEIFEGHEENAVLLVLTVYLSTQTCGPFL